VPAAETGTYLLGASLTRNGTVVGQRELSVPVPYSPEYLELGRDDTFLGQLARSGGALLRRPAAAWSQPKLGQRVSSPVFWLLLLLVAIAWPLDIAMRRLTVSPGALWRRIRALRREGPGASRAPEMPTER
jgi:hypothetical protein